ncbi:MULTISPECIES: hypothetical protein [unclassified Janthinobacterium]|uniref:hypothetical protein n=1 Tax=unclassified Janthinobacterium TaxID=2610881 RepID=UPI000AD2FD4D|nr:MULTISPECIES: hypothetical protein [unclassified Janthinobacterium]
MIVTMATGVATDADDAAIVANIAGRRSPVAGALLALLRVPRETKIVVDWPMLSKN